MQKDHPHRKISVRSEVKGHGDLTIIPREHGTELFLAPLRTR